jgi:hypothetical protein
MASVAGATGALGGSAAEPMDDPDDVDDDGEEAVPAFVHDISTLKDYRNEADEDVVADGPPPPPPVAAATSIASAIEQTRSDIIKTLWQQLSLPAATSRLWLTHGGPHGIPGLGHHAVAAPCGSREKVWQPCSF